jgi:alkaline phosphatase
MKKYILFSIIAVISSCSTTLSPDLSTTPVTIKTAKPKNIILMIGDGMGVTQITAGLIKNGRKLNLEKFPFVGLHKSFAYGKDLITDSAAGATAFSCGVKSYNGAIGVNHDTLPIKTILEIAEERGLATGMVATSSITHATPGSFIAHVKHRDMMQEIALDFLKTSFDCFVGGGRSHFERRKDGRNLTKELEKKGYQMFNWIDTELNTFTPDKNKPFGFYTADTEPLPFTQGRDYLPSASSMVCNFLKGRSDKGFFLMIEGSQIDWGGHANDSDYIWNEMIDFDKAIGKVLDFAAADGNTLVIVTADHECGGYSIIKGTTDDKIIGSFATDYHTPDLIPVFAYGPGAEKFSGIYENTVIFDLMKKLMAE